MKYTENMVPKPPIMAVVFVFCIAGGCAVGGTPKGVSSSDTETDSDSATVSDDVMWDPTTLPEVSLSPADIEKEWVTIPAATFMYGAPESSPCWLTPETQVEVTITRPFKMARTEVTRAEWRMNGFPDHPSNAQKRGCDTCPVDYVSWFDIFAWLNTLSRVAGFEECYDLSSCIGDPTSGCPEGAFFEDECFKEENDDTEVVVVLPQLFRCTEEVRKFLNRADCKGYRLPTAAEWELAARGGTTTRTYNGDLTSDRDDHNCWDEPTLEPIAWYCNNTPDLKVQPVGQLAPNAYGLYDMIGNATEFIDHYNTASALQAEEQKEAPLIDPVGITGWRKLYLADVRGGHIGYSPCRTTATYSLFQPAEFRTSAFSFRPVRTIQTEGDAL